MKGKGPISKQSAEAVFARNVAEALDYLAERFAAGEESVAADSRLPDGTTLGDAVVDIHFSFVRGLGASQPEAVRVAFESMNCAIENGLGNFYTGDSNDGHGSVGSTVLAHAPRLAGSETSRPGL